MKKLILLSILFFTGVSAQAASLTLCASIFSDYDIAQYCSSLKVDDSLVKACDEAFLFRADKLDCIDERNSKEKVQACNEAFSSIDGKKGCLQYGKSVERIEECGKAFSSELNKFDCI